MHEDKRTFGGFLRRNGLALLLTAGVFCLMYFTVLRFQFGDNDYDDHMVWALAMTPDAVRASFYDGSARLWHICVRFLFLRVTHNLWTATAVTTAAADAAAYFIVFRAFETALPERRPSRWLLALLTAAPFIVSSLTVPGAPFYVGMGAVNTWQNPTNIAVRPFGAAVFYMTVRIYNRYRYGGLGVLAADTAEADPAFADGFFRRFRQPLYRWWELILYPLCLLLSVYAKPSFLQFFAPAIFVFLVIDLIRTKGRLFPFCVKLALPFLPAAIILFAQLFHLFPGLSSGAGEAAAAGSGSGSGAGIAVYFLLPAGSGAGEFLSAAFRCLKSVVLPGAFAFAILLINRKDAAWRPLNRLALLCVLAALAEYILLHETGARDWHGNFTWGLHMATWLAWGVAAAQYGALLRDGTRRGRLARWIGTPLLAWHLASGAAYLEHIFRTFEYYC